MATGPRPIIAPPPLDDAARAESLRQTLADDKATEPLWLFAYGSLIWDPCFTFTAHCTATLDGYHRAFNFWSVLARGTPERPGLGLGLEAGGSCNGVAFRLAERTRQEDLDAIWRREMYGTVYRPAWLPISTPDGPITALIFISNTSHAQYSGDLSREQAAAAIADADGENGTCRDYLEQTIASLNRHGLRDPGLEALLDAVNAIAPTR